MEPILAVKAGSCKFLFFSCIAQYLGHLFYFDYSYCIKAQNMVHLA